MTEGGPANASTTMVTYLIYNGFESDEFGYGSAVAVILFMICFLFALLYQRFALRRDTARRAHQGGRMSASQAAAPGSHATGAGGDPGAGSR